MYYNDQTLMYLDGRYVKAADVGTNLYSQTLHYGYGVFEGIRAYKTKNGTQIFKAKAHYERLKESCRLLGIPFHYSIEQMEAISMQLLAKNQFEDAYLRPLVFCAPNMSLTFPNESTLAIMAWQWGAYLGDKLLKLGISSYCRPHPKSTHIEAKACGHYINSTLASSEAKARGYDEALMLDVDGNLAEGPGANFFYEKNGVLYTPPTGHILPGITRQTVIEICQQRGIDVREERATPAALVGIDGAFYCGTAAEIVGIESIDGKAFNKPWAGTIGHEIQRAYRDLVTDAHAPIRTQEIIDAAA